jgi:hypothetical protein
MAWMKVDKTLAAWGIVFGALATLSGMFLLEAVDGGFVAEGFFLIVLSWVVALVVVAKLFQVVGRLSKGRKEE